jgi:hypothetical protein
MSRILKRPMFRMGGSTENVGIMDGMRQRYSEAGRVEDVLKQLDERAPAPNFGRSQFLTEFGLNLLATPPQGNIFQTAAVAARDPFARFQENKARSAASRREIMAQLMGQQRQFEFDRDLQRERLEAQERIAGVERDTKEAIDNFPEAGNPVIAKKLNVILKSENAINAPGQIVPDGQNITKTIQNLNPDAGVVFALYNPLTGDVTKFVRVEKGKNNRVLLAEVDSMGNDLPGGESDTTEGPEEFPGQRSINPSYRRPPKDNFFKTLEPKEAFDIDEPQA